MADKAQTPPPPAVISPASSPLTPEPKRARMSSPNRVTEKLAPEAKKEEKRSSDTEKAKEETKIQSRESTADPEVVEEVFNEEDDLEADDGYADSTFGDSRSDTTSVTSSIYQGIVENGRRYQTKREGEYWGPADEKQFQSMEASHVVNLLLESKRENPYFLSPIQGTPQNILDIGTGSGIWAKDVADLFPSTAVLGIDLSPPPDIWVPPNCKLEVDDVLKPWHHENKFNLLHMRDMFGSFTDEQWALLYKQAYDNVAPGGWIEQVEQGISHYSNDGSLAPDSILGQWGPLFHKLMAKSGKGLDTIDHFKSRIEVAGFKNVHEKVYKIPVGDWAKDPVMKEAGRLSKTQFLAGMEGYTIFVLTRFGEPTPWTAEEVQVFLEKTRQEVNDPKLHMYYMKRRVWAQKPLDAEAKVEVKA